MLGQEILNELLLIRFNTGPPGHLDESIYTRVVSKFFAVKKRMGKRQGLQLSRLTTLKLYCPLPTETSKHQLPPSESNEVKKRKRIVKPKQLQGVIVCVCVPV